MQEIVDLTKDLIRFKSTHSKPKEIRRCFEFIEKFLANCSVKYRRLDHQKFPCILVASQSGFVPILLMTHIDVVDAPVELFNPLEKDNRLYGRGSLDDKYAVALSLVLVKNHMRLLRKEGKNQDDLPFGILITSDEEIGGFYGAKKALQEIRTDFCMVLDGGNIEKIVVKEKGLVRVKLVSRANVAGASKTWLGENAIEKLIDDYIKLRTYFVKSVPEHWHRAVTFSSVKVGKSHNQVPEYAEALIIIRYTENDNMEELVDKMNKELQSEIIIGSIEPVFDKGQSSYLDLLMSIAKNTEIGFENGSNDARFLSQYGIKGIVWGADGDRSQHSLTEHVHIESVYTLYRILDEFVRKIDILSPKRD